MQENLQKNWNLLNPQLISIFLTFIVICTFCIVYNVKIRNKKDGQQLSGFFVLTETFITQVENMIVTVMGKGFKHLTPYAMYIFMYVVISSILAILGFEPLTSSFTVTLSMGLVTFFGIYYYGIRYQKLAFFKKFLNPVELLTQFVPLVSISFRLFGNMLGGSIFLGLLYGTMIGLQGTIFVKENIAKLVEEDWHRQFTYWWGGFNIFTTALMPWLHLYFDLFDGVIQSIVFVMLTLSYWGNAKDGEHETDGDASESENIKKLKRKEKLSKELRI